MIDDRRVVFLDLETTGGSASSDRIIEIGCVEAEGDRLVEEWSTLVNPGRRIPQGVQALTGITDEAVVSAPAFDELSAALEQRLAGKILAAHNARFDYGFLRTEFARAGIRYTAPVLCTVKLSRRLFPHFRRHNLDALIARHAIFCADRHRALGDARVLWTLAQIWRREFDAETLDAACAELLKAPSLPQRLPADTLNDLPERAGVYIFHGDDERALYVGRAANLRSRVLAHFSGEGESPRDAQIAREVRRIEWHEAAGELGACLREWSLIRRLEPVYNRTRKTVGDVFSWRWRFDLDASPPQLVSLSGEDEFDGDLFGLFRSADNARRALEGLAASHRLCRKLLGLDCSAHAPCSMYGANGCAGACIGAEKSASHALRVAHALAKLRLPEWPYAGPVAIRERDAETGRAELHVFDRWRCLAAAATPSDLAELGSMRCRAPLDPDVYKMLLRIFRSRRRSCDILPVPRPQTESEEPC